MVHIAHKKRFFIGIGLLFFLANIPSLVGHESHNKALLRALLYSGVALGNGVIGAVFLSELLKVPATSSSQAVEAIVIGILNVVSTALHAHEVVNILQEKNSSGPRSTTLSKKFLHMNMRIAAAGVSFLTSIICMLEACYNKHQMLIQDPVILGWLSAALVGSGFIHVVHIIKNAQAPSQEEVTTHKSFERIDTADSICSMTSVSQKQSELVTSVSDMKSDAYREAAKTGGYLLVFGGSCYINYVAIKSFFEDAEDIIDILEVGFVGISCSAASIIAGRKLYKKGVRYYRNMSRKR